MIYTNLADSIVYAGFQGHQYGFLKSLVSEVNLSTVYKGELMQLLKDTLNGDDTVLVVTLNQICDNRYLLLEDQKEHFEILKRLIENGKLKISTYPVDCKLPGSPNHTLISYTEQALVKCLKRLCKGENSPDLVYISSLFPDLGDNSNPAFAAARGIKRLLGSYPKELTYNEKRNIFSYKKEKIKNESRTEDWVECTLDYLWQSKKRSYGYYVALKKYNTTDSFHANDLCTDISNCDEIMMWLGYLFELHEIAQNKGAYIPNVRTGIRLNHVMQYVLLEKKELNKRLDMWLGNIEDKEIVKLYIIKILDDLLEYKNRTDMYINIKRLMDKYYYDVVKTDHNSHVCDLFDTSEKKRMRYKRVLYTIQSAIDWTYNILNTLLASDKCTMREYSFEIKKDTIDHYYFKNFVSSDISYENFLPFVLMSE